MENRKKNTVIINTPDEFLYSNSFGVLFKDSLVLQLFNKNTPISLCQIDKVIIHKKRILIPNFIFFSTAIFSLLNYFYFINQINVITQIILISITIMLFLTSLLVTKKKYKMIVVRKQREAIKIEFQNYYKQDAIVIMQKVNRYLKQLEKLTNQTNK